MSTYLQWLVWGGANVYIVAALAWACYRLGYKSGFNEAERERAVAALSGEGAGAQVIVKTLGVCPSCRSITRGYKNAACRCSELRPHSHVVCTNCQFEHIVQP